MRQTEVNGKKAAEQRNEVKKIKVGGLTPQKKGFIRAVVFITLHT